MSVALVRATLRRRSNSNPSGSYKRQQARISWRRLYPLTVFYAFYSATVLILALRTAHPWVAVIFLLAGIPMWTLVEYVFHRFVLHGRFPHDGMPDKQQVQSAPDAAEQLVAVPPTAEQKPEELDQGGYR